METTSASADRACAAVTDVLHTLANEPSVGLYYVCEHIQRSVPALVSDKEQMRTTTNAVKGADLDAGFAMQDLSAATDGGTQRALANTAKLATLSAVRLSGARRS